MGFYDDDALLVKIAQEVAMERRDVDDIVKHYGLTSEQWDKISTDRYFISLVAQATEAWHATNNTHERTRLKAATIIEEWLPEAYQRLHDNQEALPAKTGLATLVSRLAGMGGRDATIEGTAPERFVVNINLGPQKDIRLEKSIDHAKVIEAIPSYFEK
jgi:hypothetical protein